MAKRSVDVYIKAHDRASAKFRRAGRATSSLGAKLSMLKLAAGGAAFMIGVRLVRGLGSAMVKMGEFEKQAASVSTMLTDQTMHKLPGMIEGMEKLSTQYGQTTETISKGLYDILSASIPAAKAMGVLEVATRAAIGGLTDTGTAADVLTSILNSYQLSAEYATTVSDMLFATVKKGKLTYQELASEVGKVAAIGSVAGVKLKTLLAALSTMTRQGIKSAQATTALSAVIVKILNPAEKSKRIWKELGIEYGEAAIKAKGLDGIIQELTKATSGQLAKMFPKKAFLAIAAMQKDLKGMGRDINYIGKSSGEADKAFGKMADSGAQKIAELKQAWEKFMRGMGEELLPILKEWTPAIKRFLEDPLESAGEKVTEWGLRFAKYNTFGLLDSEKNFREYFDKIHKMTEEAAKPAQTYSLVLLWEAEKREEIATKEFVKAKSLGRLTTEIWKELAKSRKALGAIKLPSSAPWQAQMLKDAKLAEEHMKGWHDAAKAFQDRIIKIYKDGTGNLLSEQKIRNQMHLAELDTLHAGILHKTRIAELKLEATIKAIRDKAAADRVAKAKTTADKWLAHWKAADFEAAQETANLGIQHLPSHFRGPEMQQAMKELREHIRDAIAQGARDGSDALSAVVGLAGVQAGVFKAMGGIRGRREHLAKGAVGIMGIMGAMMGGIPGEKATPAEAAARKEMMQPPRGVEAFTARFLKRAPGFTPEQETAKNSKASLKIQKKALKAAEDQAAMLQALLDSGVRLAFADIGG